MVTANMNPFNVIVIVIILIIISAVFIHTFLKLKFTLKRINAFIKYMTYSTSHMVIILRLQPADTQLTDHNNKLSSRHRVTANRCLCQNQKQSLGHSGASAGSVPISVDSGSNTTPSTQAGNSTFKKIYLHDNNCTAVGTGSV